MNELPPDLRNLPALSIRQPWCWFIINSTKRLENRDWPDVYRDRQLATVRKTGGRFLLHAAVGMTKLEYQRACLMAQDISSVTRLPRIDELDRGGIVGVAEEGGWVEVAASPWFTGPGAIVLSNVKPLPFIPCRGMLGFFRPQLTTTG